MIENRPLGTLLAHFVLIVGIVLVAFPVYYTFIASTYPTQAILSPPLPLVPGGEFLANYGGALFGGSGRIGGIDMVRVLFNTTVVALAIAIGKITISLLSAYAIVFFRFPLRLVFFWMIFVTLMLPVEVRIVPTYQVIVDLGLLDSYAGLTVPLMASATATFLFRQFFLTIPDELCDAARIDGATPLRFLRSILLPLSLPNLAALGIIFFLFGWNQYLWPLLFTTDKDMATAVIGLKHLIPQSDAEPAWNVAMNAALLVMLPPALVVVALQRWMVKGLVDSGK